MTTQVHSDWSRTTSIALDSSDHVHIGCNGYSLRYATNISGPWVTTEVDSADYVGAYMSLALDGSDRVHISYYDADRGNLMYANNALGFWAKDIACDRHLGCGQYNSIALDGSDRVHISHHGEEGTLLVTFGSAPGCFIATACFGTEMIGKIDVLREFRDRYLTRAETGQAFVEGYYTLSPPIAKYIAKHRWPRILARILLLPTIGFVSLFV
jgi:hypothetical protein